MTLITAKQFARHRNMPEATVHSRLRYLGIRPVVKSIANFKGKVPALYDQSDLEAAFLKPVRIYRTKGGHLAQNAVKEKADTSTFDDMVFRRQQRASIKSLSVYDK